MAKEWAKSFYRSSAWKYLRKEVLRRDCFTCVMCGARATEVHHTITLSPENIGDPTVSLNPALLQSLCHACHTSITQDDDWPFYFDESGQLVPLGGACQ